MSDDDIRELWEAIDGLRAAVSAMTATMAEVKVLLVERCASRGRDIDDLKRVQDDHDRRLGSLEQSRAQVAVVAALAGAVGTLALRWVLTRLGVG